MEKNLLFFVTTMRETSLDRNDEKLKSDIIFTDIAEKIISISKV